MPLNPLIASLKEEVENNLQNEQFGVEELASAVGMSRSHLHRKLQEATGQSVSQFIREYRLEKAMLILKTEEVTASEVAYRVGFGSATYFSSSFTDFYGYPPSEAKKRAQEEENKEEAEAEEVQALPQPVGRSGLVVYVIISVVVILLGWFFFQSDETDDDNANLVEDPKSIAVLPFKNLSVDEENQYFADGVMDAILNKLAKVGELSVTSRTSVEKYREATLTIPEIASELDVAYILEGSAQKYGDDIKITAQLIRASSDDHLWSEEYTRKFVDVLTLQGEIAERVANELHAVLTSREKAALKRPPTSNPEAYDYKLLADFQFDKSTAESLGKAITLYEQALEIDPQFVDAYVGLARVYNFGGLVWGIFPENVAWTNIEQLLLKALEIDSLHGRAYDILANSLFYYKWDFKAAKENFDKSIANSGPDVNPDFSIKMGYLDQALKTTEDGIENAPAGAFNYTFRAEVLFHQGNVDEAIETLDHAYGLFDDHYFLREAAKLYYNFGEKERSREIFEQVRDNFPDRPPLFYWLQAIHEDDAGNNPASSLAELKRLFDDQSSGSPAWFLAIYYALKGNDQQVFHWLEKSYERHEVEMTWLKMEPLLKPFKNDRRYARLMEKMDFPQ